MLLDFGLPSVNGHAPPLHSYTIVASVLNQLIFWTTYPTYYKINITCKTSNIIMDRKRSLPTVLAYLLIIMFPLPCNIYAYLLLVMIISSDFVDCYCCQSISNVFVVCSLIHVYYCVC